IRKARWSALATAARANSPAATAPRGLACHAPATSKWDILSATRVSPQPGQGHPVICRKAHPQNGSRASGRYRAASSPRGRATPSQWTVPSLRLGPGQWTFTALNLTRASLDRPVPFAYALSHEDLPLLARVALARLLPRGRLRRREGGRLPPPRGGRR